MQIQNHEGWAQVTSDEPELLLPWALDDSRASMVLLRPALCSQQPPLYAKVNVENCKLLCALMLTCYYLEMNFSSE
jgi:hypothetical protein